MDPKAVFGISTIHPNIIFKGIILELTFYFKCLYFCDYRLIGKSFIFQVNIVGSSPTNHKKIRRNG